MVGRQDVTIDVDKIKDIALRGVRRAVAFLGLSLQATRDGPPKSVALESKFIVQWFADPLPNDLAIELVTEYESWIIGSGLKELDQYFGMFLDEIWSWLRIIEYHGKSLPSDFGPDQKFVNDTNVAAKLSRVEEKLGVTAGIASSFFQGYSLARNALSHNVGIVRQRDTNEESALVLRWHAPTVVVTADGTEHISDQTTGIVEHPFGRDAQVVFRMRERRVRYTVGQRIVLSRFDLSEICFSYQNATEAIVKQFLEYLRTKGITQ